MKTFYVPLVVATFRIFSGKSEWEKFRRAAIKTGANKDYADTPCPGKGAGRAYGGAIWVESLSDEGTLIHELSHFIDDLMEFLKSDDSEFRAYCTEWVFVNVLEWAKEMSK